MYLLGTDDRTAGNFTPSAPSPPVSAGDAACGSHCGNEHGRPGAHAQVGLPVAGITFLTADWTKLQHGDVVRVRGKDGPVLWVTPDGPATRRMHHRTDSEEMWSLRQTADNLLTINAQWLTLHARNQPFQPPSLSA